MSIVALIPVAQMAAANLALEEAGFGPGNFSVPAYGATGVTHAALHAWEDSAFREALALVPGVVVGDPEDEGDPITLTAALIAAQGAKWGAQAPALPTLGNFRAQDNLLTQAAVDAILAAFDAAGRNSGTRILNLGGTGNAAPSAGKGDTSKNNLLAKGWTVTTN